MIFFRWRSRLPAHLKSARFEVSWMWTAWIISERDSYFCGTNYGKIDTAWLIQNLTFHRRENKMYLALNRRALYSFDDFLISRHHMHLMVYCHHKSIIYEEMLNRYLTSPIVLLFCPEISMNTHGTMTTHSMNT